HQRSSPSKNLRKNRSRCTFATTQQDRSAAERVKIAVEHTRDMMVEYEMVELCATHLANWGERTGPEPASSAPATTDASHRPSSSMDACEPKRLAVASAKRTLRFTVRET
ncbi:conserved hypothetical protein, partial [Ricinus communis]